MDATNLVQKRITWEANAWECDPLHVVVYVLNRQTGQKEPVEIQPDWISVTAEPDVLEMEAPEPAGDFAWRVPVKVKKEPFGPATIIMGPSRPPQVTPGIGEYSENAKPPQRAPENPLKVNVTVEVSMMPTAATAAISAAGMMPFGVMRAATQLLRKRVVYQVIPPRLTWAVRQDKPVRLTSAETDFSSLNPITVECTPPEGWMFDISARFLILDKCKKLGLDAEPVKLAESASEETLAAEFQIYGTQHCFKPVVEVSYDGSEGNVPLRFAAVTTSPYLGTQAAFFDIAAQAQPIAVYLGDRPAASLDPKGHLGDLPLARFEWDEENSVSVIGESHQDGTVPPRARLPLALKTAESWDTPEHSWQIDTGAGDDRIEGGSPSEYVAPHAKPWREAGEPPESLLYCETVGEHGMVEGWEEEGLWRGVPIFANVGLILRKYIAHLKMRVGPTDLLQKDAVALDLTNPAVEKSLIREVDVYLEIED